MTKLKYAVPIGLAISAVFVLGLLVVKVVGNAKAINAANSDPDLTATHNQTLDTPTWTTAPSLTPTIRPTITILVPTETLIPTPSQVSNSSYQPPSADCDVAGFVADITIPDGTELAPGTTFTKTWSLRNDGTCTWNSDYQIYFYSGSQMSGPSSQPLVSDGEMVDPGNSIDLSVELTAPDDEGSYIGYWALENASGTHFGIGIYGEPFYVEIYVSSTMATITSTSAPSETPLITDTPGSPTDTPEPDTATPEPDTATPELVDTAAPDSTATETLVPSNTPVSES